MASDTAAASARGDAAPPWPELPYKGLGYYTAEDTLLFAGRDDDITRCATLLGDWRSRLLLLHGSTGCGKSSFLRAGLIPFLEAAGAGITFVRMSQAPASPVLFVRCTADPLTALADALFRFASRTLVQATPAGPREVDLRQALVQPPGGEIGAPAPQPTDARTFCHAHADDPAAMLAVLERLSLLVPETLVLVVDQGEEVLTLDRSVQGDRWRERFFDFLGRFALARFDIKLLVALRTEYFGRFVSHTRLAVRGGAMAEYHLEELSTAQKIAAILRPVEEAPRRGQPAPSSVYRFSFEPGVPDRIVQDLARAGGQLPALQIVCLSLHDVATRRDEPWRIELADLERIGGVAGSLERFMDQRLYACAEAQGLAPVLCQREVQRWKEALHSLARLQPDGTVTTDLWREARLRQALADSRLDFERAVTLLEADDARLLRRVQVVDVDSGGMVPCFGLGHDALGLVLRAWKARHDRERELTLGFEFSDDEPEDERASGKDIALCLSSGGFRALLFHLGGLRRLNEQGYLPRLARVSGVSAGAMLAAHLGLRWKALEFDAAGVARNFDREITEPILAFTARTIDRPGLATLVTLFFPAFGYTGADILGWGLSRHLLGKATLQDLPLEPDVVFTAVDVQGPSLFRFTRDHMGSAALGRIEQPTLTLAEAVAASAAAPPLFAPMTLKLDATRWVQPGPLARQRPELLRRVHLMDGALQDHLGLDAVWNRHRTLLVSDGSWRLAPQAFDDINWLRQLSLTFDLQAAKIRLLRQRQIVETFRSGQKQGAYWSFTLPAGSEIDDLQPWREAAARLSTLPTRFAELDLDLQRQLDQLGYVACGEALRRHFGESLMGTRPAAR